ncbi:[protein-PII] uridylyltransferase [Aeromicrobium sp.]|uniref:[protein-PII] uridylyltransferase n=1 Tax=Aeromicrobium sp. TaxID=1871063 RepID=UPI0025BAD9A5|nr:[protein-PII] uridylyltransferase [Aeromicrobium sp.]MCK5890720.1 [protein-PII] uridylyltransferase [Aeromicrobium sp.]
MSASTPREGLRSARQDRTLAVDRLVRSTYVDLVPTGGDARIGSGVAVVAVGGYGRGELTPFGDVDVVLVHDDEIATEEVARLAEGLWYPLWDRGLRLDHAVRSATQMREAARGDFKVAMGWLDARAVAGDSGLVLRLRSEVLADWRAGARPAIDALRHDRSRRQHRAGWLAYAAVPDLKDAAGGLRDAVVLRALVATWLVDAPLGEVESLRSELLDVRDVLHEAAGRATDRLDPQLAVDVAERLEVSRSELQVRVRDAGRRLDHVGRLTWRRLDQTLALSASRSSRDRARTVQVAPGIGRDGDEVAGEIVLTGGPGAPRDGLLALRAAAFAARAGLPLSPSAAAALASSATDVEWDERARRALVGLLTAGPGLVDVWHELDVAGLVERWLPEWSDIRLRGSSSPVHRYTIDRHSVETCVLAVAQLRSVERPDLLAVAALLHDIGKGRPGDHSEVGAPMARDIALRWGFAPEDADVVGELVRWHLLLPTVATRRDIEDPATAVNVAEIVRTERFLDLLAGLTRADGAATSSEARSRWRRGLIDGLVEKVRATLQGASEVDAESYEGWPDSLPFPDLPNGPGTGDEVRGDVVPHHDGSLLTIVAPDSPGLLARVAGALALAGIDLHSLRTVTRDGHAVSVWETPRADVDRQLVLERIRRVLAGDVDLDVRLDRPAKGDDDPRVLLVSRANLTGTMLEVRALDRRGLIYLVARAVHEAGASIRSAHVSTFGAEVRDVFYLVDAGGDPLDPTLAEHVRATVESALA